MLTSVSPIPRWLVFNPFSALLRAIHILKIQRDLCITSEKALRVRCQWAVGRREASGCFHCYLEFELGTKLVFSNSNCLRLSINNLHIASLFSILAFGPVSGNHHSIIRISWINYLVEFWESLIDTRSDKGLTITHKWNNKGSGSIPPPTDSQNRPPHKEGGRFDKPVGCTMPKKVHLSDYFGHKSPFPCLGKGFRDRGFVCNARYGAYSAISVALLGTSARIVTGNSQANSQLSIVNELPRFVSVDRNGSNLYHDSKSKELLNV